MLIFSFDNGEWFVHWHPGPGSLDGCIEGGESLFKASQCKDGTKTVVKLFSIFSIQEKCRLSSCRDITIHSQDWLQKKENSKYYYGTVETLINCFRNVTGMPLWNSIYWIPLTLCPDICILLLSNNGYRSTLHSIPKELTLYSQIIQWTLNCVNPHRNTGVEQRKGMNHSGTQKRTK